jgi:hypothetical protein
MNSKPFDRLTATLFPQGIRKMRVVSSVLAAEMLNVAVKGG